MFILVFARDETHVQEKVDEIRNLGFPFIVVCGKSITGIPEVVFRHPAGKWDAINFGYGLIPSDTGVVVLNDVDTHIHNLGGILSLASEGISVTYGEVKPVEGPQVRFYRIANPLNKVLSIFAMGELMVIEKHTMDKLMPIPPCMAEDSYFVFKASELGYSTRFCGDSFVTTTRTKYMKDEVAYKARTTIGILQALEYARPRPTVRVFYWLLPILAMMLFPFGDEGRAWSRGIFRGIAEYLSSVNRTSF